VLNLDVVAPPPLWTVNPADYENAMSLIGELAIDSVLSTDKNDIIAVFSGNECRGVGQLQYLTAVDKWLVFLDIYSHTTGNEPLSFKVWDASEGVIRSEVTPSLTFSVDAVLGSISNPVYINATNSRDQYIPLSTGWNWFSLNLWSAHITDINYVLQDVQANNGDQVKAQDSYAQFNSGLGWEGNLQASGHFKNTEMYMIKLNHADTIRFVGKVVDPLTTPITIHPGWNWIGFIPQVNLTVNDALASYNNVQNGDVIKGQSSFAMYQTGLGWLGSLSFLEPGKGYKFRSLDTVIGTFNYPLTGSGLKLFNKTEPKVPIAWNSNMKQYEYNLSLVATVDMGQTGMVNSNMVLGTFVNDVSRGYIKPVWVESANSYMFFLPVNSNVINGENISFRLYDPIIGSEYEIKETIAFESNAVLGNIENPVKLTLSKATNITTNPVLTENYLQLQPNPFREETVIAYRLTEDAQVRISVFNLLGEEITVLADKHMLKGAWKQVWNGDNEYGAKLSPGVYYLRMQANKFSSQIKMVIIN